MHADPFKNTLLKQLDSDTLTRLELTPVSLPLLHDLETPGKAIHHLFFLEKGIGSMTTCFEDGSQMSFVTTAPSKPTATKPSQKARMLCSI